MSLKAPSRRALLTAAATLAASAAKAGWWPRFQPVTAGATVPTITPGNGYTQAQRDAMVAPGKTDLSALARPEYTSYAQIGLTTDASYTPPQAAPNGHLLTPLVSGVPYFSDYLVTFTGFAQGDDGTIRDGCTARVTVSGSDPVILHAGEIDVAQNIKWGGTKKVDGFQFILKWDSASADCSATIRMTAARQSS